MPELLHDENGVTITLARTSAARRCAICGDRSAAGLYRLAELDAPADQRRSWLLCPECTRAVRQEVDRAGLQTALRARIAVGIVASQRRRASRASFWSEEYWENLDDAALNRILKWFLTLAFVVKMLTVVGVAFYVTLAH